MEKKSFCRKLPYISFLAVAISVGVLTVFGLINSWTDLYINIVVADILAVFCVSLPIIGFILGIVSLCLWKKISKIGRGVAIVTVIVANPLFVYFYSFICFILTRAIANIPWM